MPPKRTGEHLNFKNNLKEKCPKLTDVEVINIDDDFEKYSVSDSSSAHSTMDQLEDHVRASNKAAVRQLLKQQHVDLKTPEGGDLLWTAYVLDKTEIATMLVRHGANLRVRKLLDNRTLLHHMLKGHGIKNIATRELFKLMLDRGAEIDARDIEGNSLLNCAITSSCQGSTELAEELLKYGARVTIDKEDRQRDDIFLACKHKMELLPKLILHQNPDVETRDRRAIIAVERLISENYTGTKGAAALLIMKKILDLGVPVNVPPFPDIQRCRRKFSFLDTALWFKNKPAVELLLECGADPHQHNVLGHTTLYQATAFDGNTQVSRWLIERGVSIRARNNLGGYPIHGACINESVRNIHLLLNLGANLRAVDKCGVTPFGAMKMNKRPNEREAHYLVIKHLALMVARGEKISKKDRAKIDECVWSKRYFEKCTKQLARMKEEKVHRDVSYFSLFSKNMYSTLQSVKDRSFVKSFKRDEERRNILFPEYFYILMNAFEVAEKRLVLLFAKTEEIRKVFNGSMPDSIVEKIAYYVCFEKLEHCRYDYFMNYHHHAKVKYTETDKLRFL